MLIPVSHTLPLTTIQRQRFLPPPGKVLVRAGQEVAPDEVIAITDAFASHISIDLERGLGVPKGKITQYLKRKVGDEVAEGAVIASRSGVLGRTVRAPRAGKLVTVGGGQVLLKVSQKPFELKAGIPGTVIQVEADYGAIIQTTGAWVQGVWGNGKVSTGGLAMAVEQPDQAITKKDLDPALRGLILLAGYCVDPQVFDELAKFAMRGLILGSMATRLIPLAMRAPYPVVVLDGFGAMGINMAAFRLLSTNIERDISLNAAPYDRNSQQRPEVVIPMKGQGAPPVPMDLQTVAVGQQVHILRAPYHGQVGTIDRLMGVVRFPNGLRVEAAEVSIGEEEKALVPLANIEILG
jgi:hypothetical protein